MAFDINWNLLTDSSRNLGNALANVGQQVGERRREARTNNALADAMANPKDPEAQDRLRRVDPRLAMQTEQLQRQRLSQLREDQKAELGFAARAFDGVQDDAGYRNALANIQRAGFDVSDYPSVYDQSQIGSIVKLGRLLNPTEMTTFQRDLAGAGYQPGSPDYQRIIEQRYAPPPKIVTGPNGELLMVPQTAAGPSPATSSIPKINPGDIMDGYRFKGGDPGDSRNWEAVS